MLSQRPAAQEQISARTACVSSMRKVRPIRNCRLARPGERGCDTCPAWRHSAAFGYINEHDRPPLSCWGLFVSVALTQTQQGPIAADDTGYLPAPAVCLECLTGARKEETRHAVFCAWRFRDPSGQAGLGARPGSVNCRHECDGEFSECRKAADQLQPCRAGQNQPRQVEK